METLENVDPKEAELLLRFAREYQAQTRKGIPAKRLAKLLYMADIIGRQYLGKPLSYFRYIWWKFGPYDHAIAAVAKELALLGLAERFQEWDDDSLTIRFAAKQNTPLFSFLPGEAEVIRYVVENYLAMPMVELINEVVYLTEPMKQGRKGVLLPMTVVDNAGRNAVGFDLEDVLRAEEEIDAGQGAATF